MLNPITYTENVISDFLRYQITTYPFADPHLYNQMRTLLNLEETRATPLLRGPYISLSRSFRQGATITDLVGEGVLHPHLANLAEYPHVYGHQEEAIRAITSQRHTIVSTGTGSGKTESFLYPIISRCLALRDQNRRPGIVAVIVYPMNALAEDQLGRMRDLLAGSGITFGMYVGKTPQRTSDVTGMVLPANSSRQAYQNAVQQAHDKGQNIAVHPPEERVSRQQMRTPGQQPRILLTNVKQLELLLTRQTDVQLFDDAALEFLVMDEAHTFSGAAGAETACLIRRLRAFCNRQVDDTVCIATSATIVDAARGAEAGRDFAVRFFGVERTNVALVTETYEADIWAEPRAVPNALPGDPAAHLSNVLEAVEADDAGQQIRTVVQAMLGQRIDAQEWEAALYDLLSANELVYQLAHLLGTPRPLASLVTDLGQKIGRPVSEEEVLLWLALGAAARLDARPLLRPVVHGFVRGVDGAVVTFPHIDGRPQLWLSAADATTRAEADSANSEDDSLFRLPVTTCTTCGQHYFVHAVEDFTFTAERPGGGQQVEARRYWPALPETLGGNRVVLLDRLSANNDEAGDDDDATQTPVMPPRSLGLFFCRYCGTLHPEARSACDGCGQDDSLLMLFAAQQRLETPGLLSRCVSCDAQGRTIASGFREPARPVRAVSVSDVHVLAQNMIHHAERKRLLVFADNRQDAAFQAGWMQDHARRFRLRAIMFDAIRQACTISIGDVTAHMEDLLDDDEALSRALIPEVWRAYRKEAEGRRHNQERRYFLRIQVLRELATRARQRIGLEPWGRIQVQYRGLLPTLPLIAQWAARLEQDATALVDGIASLLDVHRRDAILLDREGRIFSKIWREGDREIQRGYLNMMTGVPRGLKLQRLPDDRDSRVSQWLSQRGQTRAMEKVRQWGVPAGEVEAFLTQIWELLTDELELLVPATLTGYRDRPVPGTAGVFQVDADKISMAAHTGVYQCATCRRNHVRPTPNMVCMAYRCRGTLTFVAENPDNYDLMVLDDQFEMLRPREHSAQVPSRDREILERIFKGTSEQTNTLVCTPTLEMGVDIGALDSVLMRNVPPLPANYWQRVGRAGRRHRMAVNLTYARPASHDRAYFADPLKLLDGVIHPPRLNLRNEIMIEKHVHATVLTLLYQLAREDRNVQSGLSVHECREIKDMLADCFPGQVKGYLFDVDNYVRTTPRDVSRLTTIIAKHETRIGAYVVHAFAQWPAADAAAVSETNLLAHINTMGEQLTEVINRVWQRLQWALDQMDRLDQARQNKGVLDPDEEALRGRCERLVNKLKGQRRGRGEAEGYDDSNTYAVLAAEGFLPGYGLDSGSVVGTAQLSRSGGPRETDFELPRSVSVALREYAPGNLIYANGDRFVPRFYHLTPDPPTLFQLDLANEAVREEGETPDGSLGGAALAAIPICDVDMPQQAHISDEEDYRFQLPVSVFGYERTRHGGGTHYRWGEQDITIRRAVHLRLVNVGPSALTARQVGYPVCLVCGQSRSPFSSEAELQSFAEAHQRRCGRPIQHVGLFADVVADALAIQHCADRQVAYSVAEALRMGAANVLDMETDDLQILTIARTGVEEVDVLLYDPMPGGSGLLEQLVERWSEVIVAARFVVEQCTGECEAACVDCLMTFRNAFYHRYLNRHSAARQLATWGDTLTHQHDIPPQLPTTADTSGDMPVNEAEARLLAMFQRAGFTTPHAQYEIDMGRPLGRTIPDFYFADPNDMVEGICIYLDGLSRHIHGNPATRQRDRQLREELRNREYEVIEIPASELDDRTAMGEHFYRLGRLLVGRRQAKALQDDGGWFE
ncbi:MAG: DEAD/DEAH box helicase [Gammaproteobacteria bacterium]|nr:DEAD/DEAH box helicase [Gammaproteobacteria bacterium]